MNINKGLPQSSANDASNLAQARCGELLRIISLCANLPDCQRLRELGFCEMNEVCKVSDNGAIICNLLGSRVAISRELGSLIQVRRTRK
jgi:Fe2+ transport system protein FeoA